jgi:hypothetical protein
MASSINASTSGAGGVITSADNSGILNLQSGGTTIATINSTGFSTATGSTINVPNTFGYKNRLINGAMQISQRGTTINSISTDGTYTADRWYIARGGTINYTQSTSSPPTGFQYYASYINQSAGNPFLNVTQLIESINSFDLLGQTVTISVWLKAAANTAGSTAVSLSLGTATTADTKLTAFIGTTAFTISSSAWTKCTMSVAVPSNALSISAVVTLGTMAVGDGVFVTGAQLELGSQATSFDFRDVGTELVRCQRYYETGGGIVLASNAYYSYYYKVTKRTSPTVTNVVAAGGSVSVGSSSGTGEWYQNSNATSLSTMTFTASAEL